MLRQTCFAGNVSSLLLISLVITVDHVTVFNTDQRINMHKINVLLDRRLRLIHCHDFAILFRGHVSLYRS